MFRNTSFDNNSIDEVFAGKCLKSFPPEKLSRLRVFHGNFKVVKTKYMLWEFQISYWYLLTPGVAHFIF